MLTVAALDPELRMVRKGKKPGSVDPSAKAHDIEAALAPGVSWPSLISVAPGLKLWWKYIGRSATMPPGALGVTLMATPRLTGADTLRPMPAVSARPKTATGAR